MLVEILGMEHDMIALSESEDLTSTDFRLVTAFKGGDRNRTEPGLVLC